MGKINSRAKGCRGEREWRDILRENGFEARRGQQYAGGGDSPDVMCVELDPFVHFEVKRVESLSLYKAIDQAKEDCPKGKWRAVAHKKSRKEWLVIMPAGDWIDLIKEWMERSCLK